MSNDAAGAPPPAPFDLKIYWQVLGFITLFALSPWAIVYLATAIADLNGCTILADQVLPCVIAGTDRGELLYNLASFADLAYISLTIGIMLGFGWLCVLSFSYMAWKRKLGGVSNQTGLEVNFAYYGLALVAILAAGYAVLAGWLPPPLILLVIFVAIFWVFSFLMTLSVSIRDKVRKS